MQYNTIQRKYASTFVRRKGSFPVCVCYGTCWICWISTCQFSYGPVWCIAVPNVALAAMPLSILTSQMRLQDKASQDNRANQMNPNSQAYAGSRGQPSTPGQNDDNRANQMNPNHAEYKGKSDKSKSSTK